MDHFPSTYQRFSSLSFFSEYPKFQISAQFTTIEKKPWVTRCGIGFVAWDWYVSARRRRKLIYGPLLLNLFECKLASDRADRIKLAAEKASEDSPWYLLWLGGRSFKPWHIVRFTACSFLCTKEKKGSGFTWNDFRFLLWIVAKWLEKSVWRLHVVFWCQLDTQK